MHVIDTIRYYLKAVDNFFFVMFLFHSAIGKPPMKYIF